jgi:hypothetical protein
MKLLTKEIEKRIPKLGETDGQGMDAVVHAKFFNPTGAATWFATEYDPEQRLFFGWAMLFTKEEAELGYFSLDELESVKCGFGLGIERDRHFPQMTLREAIDTL